MKKFIEFVTSDEFLSLAFAAIVSILIFGGHNMTNIEPKVADAGRYTMTETCKALGIHRNTLRRWLQAGKMKVKFRRIDNRKVIEGAEIKRAWRVAL